MTTIDWRAPFSRLAVCHVLSVTGETLVAVSLAGSLFFKVDPAQGREKVVLGLLFTMAPFALVGPFIGPFVDRVRGGPRMVIQLTMGLRALVAVGMTVALANDSIALFFAAFAMLVLAKTYAIARAAVVPSTVADDIELVEANSKLQLLSGLAAAAAGVVGWVFLQIGPAWVSGLTAIVFCVAVVAAFRMAVSLPGAAAAASSSAAPGAASTESDGPSTNAGPIDEWASPSVLVSGDVMSMIRVIVGFATFMLAFDLRGEAERLGPVEFAAHKTVETFAENPFVKVTSFVEGPPPSWYFGVVLAVSVLGGMLGAAVAPRAREKASESRILAAACGVATIAGVLGFVTSGLLAYVTLSLGVAIAAALGKQAFDAEVQADVEAGALGRVFSRFEARFQIVWVIGALVPALVRVPIPVGSAMLAVTAAAGVVIVLTGVRPRPVEKLLATPPAQRLRTRVQRSG